MMIPSCLVFITLAFVSQANLAQSPAAAADCLSDLDKRRLAAEAGIEKRIKICREISDRLHKAVEQAAKKQQAAEVASLLTCWGDHLDASLRDVESFINRKKRSGALKDFEIQLRKAIRDMEDARLKAPYEESAHYEAWIDQAKKVHDRFVDFLFQR